MATEKQETGVLTNLITVDHNGGLLSRRHDAGKLNRIQADLNDLLPSVEAIPSILS